MSDPRWVEKMTYRILRFKHSVGITRVRGLAHCFVLFSPAHTHSQLDSLIRREKERTYTELEPHISRQLFHFIQA